MSIDDIDLGVIIKLNKTIHINGNAFSKGDKFTIDTVEWCSESQYVYLKKINENLKDYVAKGEQIFRVPLSKVLQCFEVTVGSKQEQAYNTIANNHNITAEQLAFIVDEFDNGRGKFIMNQLIGLRKKWHCE